MNRKKPESGFIMLEAMLALPMIAVIMAAAGGLFMTGVRYYKLNVADTELATEAVAVFNKVTSDISEANDLVINYDNNGITIKKKMIMAAGNEEVENVRYWVHTQGGTRKLVKNDDAIPLTGNSAGAGVEVKDFSCVELKPDLYKLELIVISEVTQHEYKLFTVVYLPKNEGRAGQM